MVLLLLLLRRRYRYRYRRRSFTDGDDFKAPVLLPRRQIQRATRIPRFVFQLSSFLDLSVIFRSEINSTPAAYGFSFSGVVFSSEAVLRGLPGFGILRGRSYCRRAQRTSDGHFVRQGMRFTSPPCSFELCLFQFLT